MSLRKMDFHCPAHGFFEASEAINAPVSETWPCPQCEAVCPKVWLKAPAIGKIEKGTFVVDFPGGHTLTRDDAEERISRPEVLPFADDPGFGERMYDKAMLKTYMRESGQLPPREVAEPTAAEKKIIDDAVAKAGATP